VGDRPPAHPLFDGPSEYVESAKGSPSLLTDRERSLLIYLAIRTIATQTGADTRDAADALDHFAARGEVAIRGQGADVYVVVAGHVIVHAERAWLRAMSQSGNPRNN